MLLLLHRRVLFVAVVSCLALCGLAQLGDTPLLTACANGRIEVVKWLVSLAGSAATTERGWVRDTRFSSG